MKRVPITLRYRIYLGILIAAIIWLIYKNYTGSQLTFRSTEEDETEAALRSGIPINVAVYYEALCPDSKNFIIKQLQTTYHRAPKLLNIELIPYGKAETKTNSDGSLSFTCQHGETECEANIIHGCTIESIHDTETELNMIACMIRDNANPKEAFHRCSKEYTIDSETIQKCYLSPHGKELLKLYGIATDALQPAVSFIPTVTLDGKQGRQASILKDLFTELCKIASENGPPPKACLEI